MGILNLPKCTILIRINVHSHINKSIILKLFDYILFMYPGRCVLLIQNTKIIYWNHILYKFCTLVLNYTLDTVTLLMNLHQINNRFIASIKFDKMRKIIRLLLTYYDLSWYSSLAPLILKCGRYNVSFLWPLVIDSAIKTLYIRYERYITC